MQEPLENQLIKASPGGSHPRLRRAASPMAWGQSGAVMALYHSGVLADIVIILGILGVFYGITQVGREWAGVLRPTVVIDLSRSVRCRDTHSSHWSEDWLLTVSPSSSLLYMDTGRPRTDWPRDCLSPFWTSCRASPSWDSCQVSCWHWCPSSPTATLDWNLLQYS